MSKQIFEAVGDGTLKGSALQAVMKENWGHEDYALLDLVPGALVDEDWFKIGQDQYELALMTTDTGLDATAEVAAGDTAFTTDAANTLQKGDVIALQVELLIVLDSDGLNVDVLRGQFGTTDVVHTAGANTSVLTGGAARPVRAGAFSVPIFSLTETAGDTDVARAINYWRTGYSDSVGGGRGITVKAKTSVTAILGTTIIHLHLPSNGDVVDNGDGTEAPTVDWDATANTITLVSNAGGASTWTGIGVKVGDVWTAGSSADAGNDRGHVVQSVTDTVIVSDDVQNTDLADAITFAEAAGQANAVLGAFRPGVEPGSVRSTVIRHVVTAADATANVIRFVLPFTPSIVSVRQIDGSLQGSVEVLNDTVATVSGGLLTLTEGSIVFVAADVLVVDVQE